MMERFQTYLASLERLTTEELDSSVVKLVRNENRNIALVIAHLAEMSRRKGAIERGYQNLFDYGVRRLNLSEGSVALRLQVANVSRRFPQILVALAEGRVSLTVAGLLAPHLNEDNFEKLLSDCAGMTKRATEEYLVAIRPKPVFEPSIRKLPEPPRPARVPEMPPPETSRPRPSPAPILAPATPTQFNFRFSADRRFKEKLDRLAEVLGVENPEKNIVEILERALDVTLDKKDPERRLARRREREAQRTKSRPDEIFPKANTTPSRYVSSEVRERIHARADYQCEYRGPDGTRCRSRTGLEIEHTLPFAIFQSHDERYLRLYCPAHNRFSAERVYGRAFIEEKVAAARGKPVDSNTTSRV